MMSGTSLDGVDAALIETDGVTVSGFGPWRTAPYPAALRAQLRAVIEGRGAREDTERALTAFHADAAEALLAEAGVAREEVAVAGFPGHTVRHEPEAGLTDQIGDGAALARRLGIDVVNDFRSNDVRRRRAGGAARAALPCGARATQRARRAACRAQSRRRRQRHLDRRPADEDLLAFDTGPGCALIDDWVLGTTGAALDRDGRLARSGTVDRALWMPCWRIPTSTRGRPSRWIATNSTRRPSAGYRRAMAPRRWWPSRRKPCAVRSRTCRRRLCAGW